MPSSVNINNLSGPSSTSGYNGVGMECRFDLPLTRVSHLGTRPIIVTGIALYLAGRSASRTITLGVGSARTAAFSLSSAGSASLIGAQSISAGFTNTATSPSTTVGTYSPSGSYYFGRATQSGNTITNFSLGANSSLVGTFNYAEVPTAPFNLVLTPGSGNVTATWDAPTSTGDSAITGYTLQYGTDPSFSTSTEVTTAAGTRTAVFSVSPGNDYYVRVAAKNGLFSLAGAPMSVWSLTASTSVGIAGFRWDGTQEVAIETAVRWDGTQEVALETAVRWDGTQEVALGA